MIIATSTNRAMRLPLLSLLAASALASLPCGAQSITTHTGTGFTTASLSTAATFGSSMQGMLVSAHFADATVITGSWSDLGEGLYGVSTSRFQLSLGADENTGAPGAYLWRLDNLWSGGLTRLVLRGAPGRTVFDMNGDEELTANSALGIPLTFSPDVIEDLMMPSWYAGTASVTYRNAVSLLGAGALGDIYEEVDLLFGSARPLAGGTSVWFDLDTDGIGANATLDQLNDDGTPPPVSTVPEPATLPLLAGGALLARLWGRRRKAVR